MSGNQSGSAAVAAGRGTRRWGWLATGWLVAWSLLGVYFLVSAAPTLPNETRATAVQPAQARLANGAVTGRLTKSIEQIQVGERVAAHNPRATDQERTEADVIAPADWRKLTLQMATLDGTLLDIVLLRPAAWLEENQTQVGGTVELDLLELGAQGLANVLAVEPCPAVAANYPFWPENRQDFVPADELESGERLTEPQEPAGVVSIALQAGSKDVCNIEVTDGSVTGVLCSSPAWPPSRVDKVLGARYVPGDEDATDVTPELWRSLELVMEKPDGSQVSIHLLRPLWWLDDTHAKAGGTISLAMHEMGIVGDAKVLSISPCTVDWRESPRGSDIVVGTFAHENAVVWDLVFNGDSTHPLGVTANHPIWSADRDDWVAAGDLRIGEKVDTLDDEAVLTSKVQRESRQKVYNLEVHQSHTYNVSQFGILAHNSCAVAGFRDALRLYNKGPYTKAGRALLKHPNIVGINAPAAEVAKVLTRTFGGAAGINKAAAQALKGILRNGVKTVKPHAVHGQVVNVKLMSGLGAQFKAGSWEFITFLGRGL